MPYVDSLTPELPWASGSETSHAAAVKMRDHVGKQGEDVLTWFKAQGARGGIYTEAMAALKLKSGAVCPRIKALRVRGDLVKTTERREGCAVYRTKE